MAQHDRLAPARGRKTGRAERLGPLREPMNDDLRSGETDGAEQRVAIVDIDDDWVGADTPAR